MRDIKFSSESSMNDRYPRVQPAISNPITLINSLESRDTADYDTGFQNLVTLAMEDYTLLMFDLL